MKFTHLILLGVLTLVVGVSQGQAQTVLDFEDFAPPGGLVNVNPDEPYSEDGFTLTPFNGDSAVFDSATGTGVGFTTDIFGYDGVTNLVTLTQDDGNPFNLNSLEAGPLVFGDSVVTLTLTGFFGGGGSDVLNFDGLGTATPLDVDWTNLTRVEFTGSSAIGIDNIALKQVPEPSMAGLCAVAGIACLFRRRK